MSTKFRFVSAVHIQPMNTHQNDKYKNIYVFFFWKQRKIEMKTNERMSIALNSEVKQSKWEMSDPSSGKYNILLSTANPWWMCACMCVHVCGFYDRSCMLAAHILHSVYNLCVGMEFFKKTKNKIGASRNIRFVYSGFPTIKLKRRSSRQYDNFNLFEKEQKYFENVFISFIEWISLGGWECNCINWYHSCDWMFQRKHQTCQSDKIVNKWAFCWQ